MTTISVIGDVLYIKRRGGGILNGVFDLSFAVVLLLVFCLERHQRTWPGPVTSKMAANKVISMSLVILVSLTLCYGGAIFERRPYYQRVPYRRNVAMPFFPSTAGHPSSQWHYYQHQPRRPHHGLSDSGNYPLFFQSNPPLASVPLSPVDREHAEGQMPPGEMMHSAKNEEEGGSHGGEEETSGEANGEGGTSKEVRPPIHNGVPDLTSSEEAHLVASLCGKGVGVPHGLYSDLECDVVDLIY